jgi:hypothetical protein
MIEVDALAMATARRSIGADRVRDALSMAMVIHQQQVSSTQAATTPPPLSHRLSLMSSVGKGGERKTPIPQRIGFFSIRVPLRLR